MSRREKFRENFREREVDYHKDFAAEDTKDSNAGAKDFMPRDDVKKKRKPARSREPFMASNSISMKFAELSKKSTSLAPMPAMTRR
jgi:hypothetical protein